MRTIEQSTRFKRDLKREAKGRHRQALKDGFVAVLATLANDQPLAEKYQDHDLSGEWSGYRECHIKPDLLLVYQKQDAVKNRNNANAQDVLLLARLGSHSELFD
jgi:mRNA interferase YafQ